MQTVTSIVLSIGDNNANVKLPAGQVIIDKADLAALLKQDVAKTRLLNQAVKHLTAAKFKPDAAAKVADDIQAMLG